MNCRTCQSLLLEYGDRTRPSEVCPELEAHLATCASCRQELRLAQRIDRILFSQPLKRPGPDFTTRVLAALPAEPTLTPLGPQMLALAAYAGSALALFYGLYPLFFDVAHSWMSWIAAGLGLIDEGVGQLYAFLGSTWMAVDDYLLSMATYILQLIELGNHHAALIYLAVALMGLLWEIRDRYRSKG